MAAFIKTNSRSVRLRLLNTFWMKRNLGPELSLQRHMYLDHGCISVKKKEMVLQYGRANFHSTSLVAGKIIPFTLTDIGEGINEVTLKEWFVKINDRVSQFDNICEVQSDKASVTITSRYDGTVKKIYYAIDEVAPVGKPLVDIEVDEHGGQNKLDIQEKLVSSSTMEENQHTSFADKVLATPAVRRIAMENNVKLNSISGTGKGGRVLKEDILAFLKQIPTLSSTLDKTKEVSINKIQISDGITEPIHGFRKAMVKSMTDSWNIPQFVYSDEVIVTQLVNLYTQVKEFATTKNIKLTYMPFFIKAVSKALEEFPILNASVDDACENITYRECHNIGIAMDTANGLVVPNIKNVQKLTILEVARELNRLQELGKKGSLRRDDLVDGTFSLSNIGAIGGTYTKPIIMPNQVAIGALGKIQVVPRYDEMENLIKTRIICVSWTADHRIIDGATMARFSNLWKKYLEMPTSLFFD